jgi:hypothetical protein
MVSAKGMIGNGAVELPNSKQPGQTGKNIIIKERKEWNGMEFDVIISYPFIHPL